MNPRGDARDHKFTMMMTDGERQQLEQLAEADRRSMADWIRKVIADMHRAQFPPKKRK
jgi:hypothetical protein